MVMLLQERCRDLRGDRALDSCAHDLRLVLPPGKQDDPAGLENSPYTSRHGISRRVLFPAEVARGVPPGERIEGNDPGAGTLWAAGFVEADVAGSSDAQELEVDPARCLYLFLIVATMRVDCRYRYRSVRHMGVRWRDIYVVKEVHLHEMPVTPRV